METLEDVHHQFASFFKSEIIQPYAYLLSKKLQEGHICLNLAESKAEATNLPTALQQRGLQMELLYTDILVGSAYTDRKPFMLYNHHLYLHRYYRYETIILEQILKLICQEDALYAERVNQLQEQTAFLRELFNGITPEPYNQERADWQMTAAITALLNNFTIITGGPGTGKTTTVAKILILLFKVQPALKVALAAPTGKAAARLGESLKKASAGKSPETSALFQSLQPVTIHRLLRSIPDSHHFRHHRRNPLDFDVIIVDEASMIDAALMSKLLDAVGEHTRLILLGDKNQLASVEAGSLFGDLCQAHINKFHPARLDFINALIDNPSRQIGASKHASEAGHPLINHTIELTYSHRFSGDSGIGVFSKAILNNDESLLLQFINAVRQEDEIEVFTHQQPEYFQKFIIGYSAFIQEEDIRLALQKLQQLRVLCAVREGEQGVLAVNRRIEKFLEYKGFINLNGEFYEHKPIIITANNYPLGLFNGDIGIIRKDANGTMKAWFEDRDGNLFSVTPGYLGASEPVYAMTIHKSQGSEFDQAYVLLPASEDVSLLTRELLYTAITRAKHKVYLQGAPDVIIGACSRKIKRASGISQRFEAAI